jgi:hypothetical protein
VFIILVFTVRCDPRFTRVRPGSDRREDEQVGRPCFEIDLLTFVAQHPSPLSELECEIQKRVVVMPGSRCSEVEFYHREFKFVLARSISDFLHR